MSDRKYSTAFALTVDAACGLLVIGWGAWHPCCVYVGNHCLKAVRLRYALKESWAAREIRFHCMHLHAANVLALTFAMQYYCITSHEYRSFSHSAQVQDYDKLASFQIMQR